LPGVKEHLEKLGFYNVEKQISEISQKIFYTFESLSSLAANNIKLFPSLISAEQAQKFQTKSLIIDVGGTSTKVALRLHDQLDSIINWLFLFELPNQELFIAGPEKAIERFAASLAIKIREKLAKLIINHMDIKALGIVWSNCLESRAIPLKGIGAVVSERSSYHKHEWFIDGLVDGDDLAQPFLNALKEREINIASLLIANDVPLTMKALPNSCSGLVVSTGLNGTLVYPVKDSGSVARKVIFNAELGTHLMIDKAYLTPVDLSSEGALKESVQSLVAGGFLPALFDRYVVALAELGVSSFKIISPTLKGFPAAGKTLFQTQDLKNLIGAKQLVAKKLGTLSEIPDLIDDLAVLSHEIIVRAARLAALLGFASICNQIQDSKELTIALDSRLAREIPIFWEIIKNQLSAFFPASKVAKLILLQPMETEGGQISVPMLGAAAALDNFVR